VQRLLSAEFRMISRFRESYAKLKEACRGPNALPAFGAISFLESSLLPVPLDVAMVPLCLSQPRRTWLIVLIGTFGSVLGALFGYAIGALAMESFGSTLIRLYGLSEVMEVLKLRLASEGILLLLVAGITPLPFKFITMLCGAAAMSLPSFLAAVTAVRFVRFLLMALLIRIFGAGLKRMIDRRPGWYFIALLAGAVVAAFVASHLL
jgi:membrane protein YqaA with SNARE-associated domain